MNDNVRVQNEAGAIFAGSFWERSSELPGDTFDRVAGNDVLRGGTSDGPDGFVDTLVCSVSAGDGGFDRFKDFENRIELIDLSSSGFSTFASGV